MKSKNIKYPDGLNGLSELIEEGKAISDKILSRLRSDDCICVGDLIKVEDGIKRRAKFNSVKPNFSDYEWIENFPKPFKDQTGVYVFGTVVNDQIVPLYVGITRRLYARLKDHGWGTRSNTATFAHLMAKDLLDDDKKLLSSKPKDQKLIMKKDMLIKNLDKNRNEKLLTIHKMKLAIQVIDDDRDFDLAFLEMIISCILESPWNSFRTY